MIRLTNTLSGKLEEFKPIKEGEVKMYNCGPTVYDYIHIGNLRAFITADLLRRSFEYSGFKVTQVMNITDIGHLSGDGDEGEDKMTKGLQRESKPLTLEAMKELADFYADAFKADISKIGVLSPTHIPKASEHIQEDIELIEELEKKGFVYKTSDGMYFDTSKDSNYGQLGKMNQNESESRIGINSEKKNFRDFALWKFNQVIGFESPWGKGFPGWHIECSAMSKKYLGNSFDIHTGGIDLAPIHHNNEIAQSEVACGCKFVNFWVHNAFVNIDGSKMAKSEGNHITLQTLIDKNFDPLAYRYFLLQARYNSPITFSWDALQAAQNAYSKLIKQFINLGESTGNINTEYKTKFVEAIENDIDTSRALALVWDLIKDENISAEDKKATLLDFDLVLGLGLSEAKPKEETLDINTLPEDIRNLVNERETARQNKEWGKSDTLRDKLNSMGYAVKDGQNGPEISSAI